MGWTEYSDGRRVHQPGVRLRRVGVHTYDGEHCAGPHWRGAYLAAVGETTIEIAVWKTPGTQTVARALLPADVSLLVDQPLAVRVEGDGAVIVEVRRGLQMSGARTGYGLLNGIVAGVHEWQDQG